MVADDRSNPKNWLGSYVNADAGWLALRAAERPAYLASALAEYLEQREWTLDQLAKRLRCAPQQLVTLGLCLRPDPASARFDEQLAHIVERFRLDYWGLRRLLEELSLSSELREELWRRQEIMANSQSGERETLARDFPDTLFRASMESAEPPPSGPETQEQAPQQVPLARRPARLHMAQRAFHPPVLAQEETASSAVPPRSWVARLLSAIRSVFSRK